MITRINDYSPRKIIAKPLRKIVAPAMAWVYLSILPNLIFLKLVDSRNTTMSIVSMVTSPNIKEINITPEIL
jgi:hypothetical protein